MDNQEYEKPKSELQERVERHEDAVLYREFLDLKKRMTNGDLSITDPDRNRAVELAKQFKILPKV